VARACPAVDRTVSADIGQLEDMATELQVDYELFCADYQGSYLPDPHVGFAEMMRYWPTPWAVEGSRLNDLPQVLLCMGANQNEMAKHFLGGEAVAQGWKQADAISCGVLAAISAAKSLAHARLLIATSTNN
jgi:hypothetical protein